MPEVLNVPTGGLTGHVVVAGAGRVGHTVMVARAGQAEQQGLGAERPAQTMRIEEHRRAIGGAVLPCGSRID